MLKPEFEILSYINSVQNQPDTHCCAWIDVLNAVRPQLEYDVQTLNALLRYCLDTQHWIEKTSATSSPPACSIRLTPAGIRALSAFTEDRTQAEDRKAEEERAEAKRLQERLEDHSREERRHRTQNKISIIMPLVTFLLGLIVERFSGIAGHMISALFTLFA